MKNSQSILKLTSITKKFPGVLALDQVDFDLKKGEVHALVGENGAGKSTLIKIISGVHKRDGGEIELHGKKVDIRGPRHSRIILLSQLDYFCIFFEEGIDFCRQLLYNFFKGTYK